MHSDERYTNDSKLNYTNTYLLQKNNSQQENKGCLFQTPNHSPVEIYFNDIQCSEKHTAKP